MPTKTQVIHRRKRGLSWRIRYGKHAGWFVADCGAEFPNVARFGTGHDVNCETCKAILRAQMGGDLP